VAERYGIYFSLSYYLREEVLNKLWEKKIINDLQKIYDDLRYTYPDLSKSFYTFAKSFWTNPSYNWLEPRVRNELKLWNLPERTYWSDNDEKRVQFVQNVISDLISAQQTLDMLQKQPILNIQLKTLRDLKAGMSSWNNSINNSRDNLLKNRPEMKIINDVSNKVDALTQNYLQTLLGHPIAPSWPICVKGTTQFEV
jgi:hypothetical protein